MREKNRTTKIHMIKLAGIILAVYIGCRYILAWILPFFIAFIIASMLHPLVKKIERRCRKMCRWKHKTICILAVVLFWMMVFVILTGLLFILCRQLQNLLLNFNEYLIRNGGIEVVIDRYLDWGCEKMREVSGMEPSSIRNGMETLLKNAESEITDIDVDSCCSRGIEGFKNSMAFGGILLVIVVSSVIFLGEYEENLQKIRETKIGEELCRVGSSVKRAGGAYLKAQLLIMIAVSTVCVLVFWITGTDHAFLAGVLTGICDALPFLGTGTVLVPWAVIRIFQKKYFLAFAYFLLYLITSLLRDYMEPKLIGTKLGIHPMAIMVTLYVGIVIYGPAGVLLGPASALLIWKLYKITTPP